MECVRIGDDVKLEILLAMLPQRNTLVNLLGESVTMIVVGHETRGGPTNRTPSEGTFHSMTELLKHRIVWTGAQRGAFRFGTYAYMTIYLRTVLEISEIEGP